jgi:hypothetical protein
VLINGERVDATCVRRFGGDAQYIRVIEVWCISIAHLSRLAIRHPYFRTSPEKIISLFLAAAMLMHRALSAFVLLAPYVQGVYFSHVERQADCEQFGTYPVYKGPCETTSKMQSLECGAIITNSLPDCGAGRINCLKQVPAMKGCTGYPALGETVYRGINLQADWYGRLSIYGLLLYELCKLVLCYLNMNLHRMCANRSSLFLSTLFFQFHLRTILPTRDICGPRRERMKDVYVCC